MLMSCVIALQVAALVDMEEIAICDVLALVEDATESLLFASANQEDMEETAIKV